MTTWFMPYVSRNPLEFILGGVFWLGLIAGVIFLTRIKGKITPLKFFSGKPAIIFDSLLIASTIIVIAALIFPRFPLLLSQSGLFCMLFSFEMHMVLSKR
jgi:hypothetical protein